ncbi:MAG: CpaF family protein [Eubacterium sp.]|nr:CpaF family protein [Eubacterium sp.]
MIRTGFGGVYLEQERRERLKEKILQELRMTEELKDDEVGQVIDRVILEESEQEYIPLSEKLELRRALFHSIRGLDVLSDFLEDPSITEIMVNGTDPIFVERDGRLIRTDKAFESEDRLLNVINQMVSQANRSVSETCPIADAILNDGSRLNVVLSTISRGGHAVTVRKFPDRAFHMEDLVRMGSLEQEAAELLLMLVRAKYNIFVSGGTGSGKTTFLNALAEAIPGDERVITIEDVAELSLQGPQNVVRLEARNANTEGKNQIDIRELVRTSLRMRPDRIIVGEVRDAAAADMLTAMLTGHEGSLSTGHANSVSDMLLRLETMVLSAEEIPLAAIRRKIASALDIIVHLGRLRDKSRRVLEITEIMGYEGDEIVLNPLFQFEDAGDAGGKVEGRLVRVNRLYHVEKLCMAGCMDAYRILSEVGETDTAGVYALAKKGEA